MVSTPGFEPGPHWWEVSAVTIGPPLLCRVQFLKGGLVLIQDKNFHFCILPSYVLLRVTFCVIITVSCSKGSTAFCKLELHVLRQENLA